MELLYVYLRLRKMGVVLEIRPHLDLIKIFQVELTGYQSHRQYDLSCIIWQQSQQIKLQQQT